MMHFGETDQAHPDDRRRVIKQKRGGDSEIFVYPVAGHGFHCDERGSFHEASAKTRLAAHHGLPQEAHEEVTPAER